MSTEFRRHLSGLGIMLLILASFPAVSSHASDQAESAIRGGEAAAVTRWSEHLAGAEGKERVEMLIRRGEAYRALGHYRDARMDFRDAMSAARAANQPLLEAVAMQSLGYAHFLEGDSVGAEPLLRSALEKAKTLDQPVLAASCANRLGNLLFDGNRREEAVALYQEALDDADWANDPGLETSVHLNLARASEDDRRAAEELRAARESVRSVALSEEHARLLLEIAVEAQQRWKEDEGLAFRYHALREAFTLAEKSGSDRLISLTAGKLGALYEERGQIEEALGLTEQALTAAQRLQAHELLLEWEWQLGRILRAQNQREKAIAAYRRAVFHIQSVRQDIPIRYRGGRSSFRETLGPIYSELADMLLNQAGEEQGDTDRQSLLCEARDTVERIKRSEIRDYFNDPCVDARSRQVESLSPNTAVLYPIILPNRLELLVDIGSRLYRETAGVDKEKLEQTVKRLAGHLRNPVSGSSYKAPAREVFDWLIRPVGPILEEHRIETLVYVPDGALRVLPIAALWDGEHFLIERYAVATAPGLTLLDPNPLPRGDLYTMLAGISEPGPVVLELPTRLWDTLSGIEPGRINRGMRGTPVVEDQLKTSDKPELTPEERRNTMEHVKEVLALPGVDKEIQRLSEELKGNVLFNEEFQLEHFSEDFQEHDYRMVHIASHGFFGGAPEQNFIMTYDKLLNMNQLESLIRPKQLAARPVELLTLSACRTAEGDDRSPLGLTGVALKSGARSGLGSLWPVWDDAAQELLPAFYIFLKDPQNTKAGALQKAQLHLMKNTGFHHPFFWSPFILVGNWL